MYLDGYDKFMIAFFSLLIGALVFCTVMAIQWEEDNQEQFREDCLAIPGAHYYVLADDAYCDWPDAENE